jgi:CRP-like cAMP-binding protein
MDLLVGWGFALVLLSAGQLLAASVLVSAGGEARCFRLHWLTLFPHLQIDAEEAVMGGRNCEFAVAELRATPVAIAAAVLAWQSSASLGPVLAGFFYVLAPWRGSAAWQWLSAFRAPRYSVRAGAIFEPRREDLWLRWSAWVADIRLGAEILSGLWLLAWAALAAVTAAELRPSLAEKTLALLGPGWRVHTALKCGLTAIAVVVAVGVVVLVLARIQHWRSQREAARPLRGEGALRMEAALDGDLPAMLRQVPLFEATPKVDLMEIAAAMKTVGFKKGENVFVEDAPGDTFSVVLEGEFEVLKRRAAPARGADVIGRFGPGDSFGEIALLEGTARTATVRAVQPGRLLQLAKWDFMKLVAAQVGTARVHDLLQHAVFLGRLVFMAGWPFEDLVRFAKCCTTTRYAAGAQLLRKGDTNLWFHLIFDGAFEAREGGKVLRRLQPGDYFGEISLLENGLATADVFALEESRCLLMHRNDFLAFFAHDYRIGLRVEALAVARLGARLFVSR